MKNLEELNNKPFAFLCIKKLIDAGNCGSGFLEKLCDQDFCKDEFCCSFPVLAEVPAYGEIPPDCYNDNTGHRRYYPERVAIGGKAYLITNHWYGPDKSQADNRTPFMNWIQKLTAC